jgi:hypothetical protein
MSDITKCKGVNCSIKETCKRFTSESGFIQSWFSESPIKDGKCEMYWGANQDSILNKLKSITKL